MSYIEDRAIYEFLEHLARKESTSVGELIRTAVAEKYALARRPNKKAAGPKPASEAPPNSRSTIRHFELVA